MDKAVAAADVDEKRDQTPPVPTPGLADVTARTIADAGKPASTSTTAAPVDDTVVARAEEATRPVDDAKPVSEEQATARPVDDTVVTAAEAEPPTSVKTSVAEQKPTPKPAAKPKPAPRSEQRPASVANEAARGPAPGTAGAGGNSTEERGRANASAYQAKLAAHLRRFRTFPAEAREKGISGTAIVRFTVASSGAVTAASLAKSSGAGILDQAAVAMVRRASPFPPMPAGLGSSLTVNVPVRFDLR
jgi:protein TonB